MTLLLLLLLAFPAGRQERIRVHAAGFPPEVVERVRSAALKALRAVEVRTERRISRPIAFFMVPRWRDLDPEMRTRFGEETVALARTRKFEVHLVTNRLAPDPGHDLEGILKHEFVHLILGHLERELSEGRRSLPLWFHEGMAQFLAGSYFGGTDEELVYIQAALGHLLPWSSLRTSFPEDRFDRRLAYAQSASFFSFLSGELGLSLILRSVEDYLAGRAESLDAALAGYRWESFTNLAELWKIRVKEGRGLFSLLKRHTFETLLLLSIPLLFLVWHRRSRRERRAGERLRRWEEEQALGDGQAEDEGER